MRITRTSAWLIAICIAWQGQTGLAADVGDDADGHAQKASPPPPSEAIVDQAQAKSAGSTNSAAVSSSSTTFNGIQVPPMPEIFGVKFEDEIKHGYWFIKHYSPYCVHCMDIAPTWQTLYEFYYTMDPVPGQKGASSGDNMNSFTRYYDFHFGSLDCIQWGDACNKLEVKVFPTFSIYKDGVFLKKFDAKKNMENLSRFIEEQLESIRPGSRPSSGVTPPEPGANSTATLDTESSTHASSPEARAAGAIGAKSPTEEGAAATSRTTSGAISSSPTSSSSTTLMEPGAVEADSSSREYPMPEAAKPKARKSRPVNPIGTSVALTQESFQKLVTNTRDPWFVEFFAPWCHHCQALAPSWLEMAKELRGKLNVGSVNCDAEPRLCKDVRVKSYPTIHFFRGGERVEYDGLRGLGDLVNYAKNALDVEEGVLDVDETSLKKMEENNEVIFIYFYDHATASEDFEALDRLPLSLVGHAKLVKTGDRKLSARFKISTWPRLMVLRSGRANYYEGLAPSEMRDHRQVLTWMQKVWLPIVPELTVSNARDILKGKFVVLGILSQDRSSEFAQDKKELKNAALEWMEKKTRAFELERTELRDAKQLRLEEAEDRNDDRAKRAAKSMHIDIREDDQKQVGFAWVDGIFWERWIKTTYGLSVKDGERVIIADEDNRRYWDTTVSGAWITPSRTSILETIPKVIANPPKLSSKSTTGWVQRIFFAFAGIAKSHPALSLLFLSCFAVIGWKYRQGTLAKTINAGRKRGMSLGSEFLSVLDQKERGLVTNSNGKAD